MLKWERCMEELLEHLMKVADCDLTEVLDCLDSFLKALIVGRGLAVNLKDMQKDVLSQIRLSKRRVELLGKMERFRDQGEEMCACGTVLIGIGQRQEGERYCQKARDLGEAHGFLLLESRACVELGQAAVVAGRHEEGLDLMRNSVLAARLGEGDADANELYALTSLIQALFKTSAIDELEPLVLRFRELSNAQTDVDTFNFKSLLFTAQLHEVLCIHPPVLGTLTSCSALASTNAGSISLRFHHAGVRTITLPDPFALSRRGEGMKRPRWRCSSCSNFCARTRQHRRTSGGIMKWGYLRPPSASRFSIRSVGTRSSPRRWRSNWPGYRTSSGVRLCWELEEPKGPKEAKAKKVVGQGVMHFLASLVAETSQVY